MAAEYVVEPLAIFALVVAVILFLGVLLWWLLITTEGVYLGRRVVIWLYDVYARRYDNIKQYMPGWESGTLGRPLLRALVNVPTPLILDVATGTARVAMTLFSQREFEGQIIGLDYSRKMLHMAADKFPANEGRLSLIYQPAQKLPFADNTFDAVTCLEALEFMPKPDAVIAEIIRVARPGALILLTVRKGIEARLMPGKTMSQQAFADHLQKDFGLLKVEIVVWQMDYDQVWTIKPGKRVPAPDQRLEAVLCCPKCGKTALIHVQTPHKGLRCMECETWIPIGEDRVIEYAKVERVH